MFLDNIFCFTIASYIFIPSLNCFSQLIYKFIILFFASFTKAFNLDQINKLFEKKLEKKDKKDEMSEF